MIYSIGEALIDISNDTDTVRRAGGASAAFCSAVASLNGRASLITKLGKDSDGEFLLRQLKEARVNTDYVFFDEAHGTGRVMIAQSGSALCLSRRHAADMFLAPDDILDNLFKKGDILHFCSMGLIESPAKYAHIKAIKAAAESGAIIAFDLNFRPRQWADAGDCLRAIDTVKEHIDYIKASKEELEQLYPAMCGERFAHSLFERSSKLKCVIVTSGDALTTAYLKGNHKLSVPSYPADTVDATGAGDCFFGAFLLKMDEFDLFSASDGAYLCGVSQALNYASAAAAISSERLGAFCTVKPEDVEKRLRSAEPT